MTPAQPTSGPLAPRSPASSTVTLPTALAERLWAALAADGHLGLAAELQLAITAAPQLRFVWTAPHEFEVDGHPLRATKGMLVAWLALLFHSRRWPALSAGKLFSTANPARNLKQALDHAEAAAARVSPPLARAIRCIGSERGLVVVKARSPANVEVDVTWLRCNLAPKGESRVTLLGV